MKKKSDYIDFIEHYFKHDEIAAFWVLGFITMCHAIDDLVDGDKTDSEFVLSTFKLSFQIYSHPFYQQHINMLYPIVTTVHDSYRDSVMMEKSGDELWKKRVGSIIRQNANDLVLTCIMLISGVEVRNEAALKLREISYKAHHDMEGNAC